MLTGENAILRAIALLGVLPTDSGGQPHAALMAHGETAVTAITQELYLQENGTPPDELPDITAPLPLSETAAETVLPFGVAMMLASMVGDTAQESYMRGMYRQKRGLLTHFAPKSDCLPVSEGC